MANHTTDMVMVYAAQPREGTETGNVCVLHDGFPFLVYAAQPREGTETHG